MNKLGVLGLVVGVACGVGSAEDRQQAVAVTVKASSVSELMKGHAGLARIIDGRGAIRAIEPLEYNREEDGRWYAVLNVEVELGELITIDPAGNRSWSRYSVRVEEDVLEGGAEFVCDDVSDTADLCFDVVDEQGREVPDCWARAWRSVDGPDSALVDDGWRGGLCFPECAVGMPIRWMVGAPGHQVAVGGLSIASSDKHEEVVELVPGWGGVYLVTTPDGAPIVRAEIVVDGEVRASTDLRGRAVVNLLEMPDSVRVEKNGYEVVWSSPDLVKRTFTGTVELAVHMKRSTPRER